MKRSLSLSFLLVALALPLSASQFIEMPFDAVARESAMIVRATVGPITSAWDDEREVIFSTASLQVKSYLGGSGPDVLMVREVGGTVDNYTQVAIGFPELREGEEVIFFLSKWEDSNDYRIHAYNQGKYLVRKMAQREVVVKDPVTQGHQREKTRLMPGTDSVEDSLTLDELQTMIDDARSATRTPAQRQ